VRWASHIEAAIHHRHRPCHQPCQHLRESTTTNDDEPTHWLVMHCQRTCSRMEERRFIASSTDALLIAALFEIHAIEDHVPLFETGVHKRAHTHSNSKAQPRDSRVSLARTGVCVVRRSKRVRAHLVLVILPLMHDSKLHCLYVSR
jgi:hypothetical protein